MMDPRTTAAGLAIAIVIAIAAPAAAAVEPTQSWSGRVPLNERPPLQTSIAKPSDWNRVWEQCRIQGRPPKVDFQKQIGLIAVRRGSLVKFNDLNLEDGNLKTNVVVTPDMPDYMSCAIVLVNRKGIKKVNGNPVGQ